MKYCSDCGGDKFHKKGSDTTKSGDVKYRFKCVVCGKHHYEAVDTTEDNKPETCIPQKFTPDHVKFGKRFVITSIQNNTVTNTEFLQSLELYCQLNNAELIVIPLIYNETQYDQIDWDIDDAYIRRDTFSLNNMVTVLGDMNTLATAQNPISTMETLSKGVSLIVPHNQLQMKSLPVTGDAKSIILCSTGTVSTKNYPQNKTGKKAVFNHSNSAIFLDFEHDMFHLRVLNGDDDNGFYDIDGYYSSNGFKALTHVEALITGDEHVIVKSDEVMAATYTNTDSMVNVLKPKAIVRHDVLDCFTISHHHVKDHFIQYSKFMMGFNKIEDELNETIKFIEDTTPFFSETYLISSNHHDHLKRWLLEADPKKEFWNAKIFHKLTLMMLQDIEKHGNDLHKPDPFKLYCESLHSDIKFVGRTESFKICGIELSNHGDKGANGARGSLSHFSKLSDKVVIGHSHTPGIDKGAYCVGCSTGKDLEYLAGPSSWMNTHCVIYPNGKRQLINIINGKWR